MFSVDDYSEWVYWEESREHYEPEFEEEEKEEHCCGRCMKCLGLKEKDFY